MNYVLDFDIGSVLFFGLTMFFYLRHKRLRNLQDRIYTAMLFASMTAVVFDFCSASMEKYAMAHPVWLLYLVNILFLFGMQACLPLFFLYAVAAAGKFNRLTARLREDGPLGGSLALTRGLLCLIPFAVTLALLLLSPAIDFGVFRIDEAHIYRRGPGQAALYINMAFYIVAGLYVLLKNSRNIPRSKRNVILLFVVILFLAVVVQLLFPRYLITASATALALTAVFYVLQSPVDQINPLTGAFSRMQLPGLLQDYIDRGRPCTLVMIALRSFDEISRLYGATAGDELIRDYAGELMRSFPDSPVVYMDTSEFIIVKNGLMDREEAERLHAERPSFVTPDGRRAELDLRVAVVPCTADSFSAADTLLPDYVLRDMRVIAEDRLLWVDEEFRRSCSAATQLEASIDASFFEDSGLSLTLSPVLDTEGALAAEEAKLALPDDTLQYVSYGRFLQSVSQSGYAWAYYRALLRALYDQRRRYRADKRLCLTLLPAVLMEEDAPEKMLALTRELGFVPEQILFAVSESEIASSLPSLNENLVQMAESGFAFMMDDFAEGYTNMSLLITLPLDYARLHESLLLNAENDERAAALLAGLHDVLSDIGVRVIRPAFSHYNAYAKLLP